MKNVVRKVCVDMRLCGMRYCLTLIGVFCWLFGMLGGVAYGFGGVSAGERGFPERVVEDFTTQGFDAVRFEKDGEESETDLDVVRDSDAGDMDDTDEESDGVIFECSSTCVIFIGTLEDHTALSVQGTFSGEGNVGYGFVMDTEVIPGEHFVVGDDGDDDVGDGNDDRDDEPDRDNTQESDLQTVNHTFVLKDFALYSELPEFMEMVLIVQGELSGEIEGIGLERLGIVQSVKSFWNEFWRVEGLTTYSINMREGTRPLGTPILVWLYRLAGILAVCIMLFKKGGWKRKKETIAVVWIVLFLLLGVKTLVSYSISVWEGVQEYTLQEGTEKEFINYGDFYALTEEVRTTLLGDDTAIVGGGDLRKRHDCNVFVDVPDNLGIFRSYRGYLYLYPCSVVRSEDDADVLLYYDRSIPERYDDLPVLLEFGTSTLLDNR